MKAWRSGPLQRENSKLKSQRQHSLVKGCYSMKNLCLPVKFLSFKVSFFSSPGVSAQPGCMLEKWISLCWAAHLSVRITCCLCQTKKKNAYQYKYHNNSSVDRYVFQSLYFILSVGHGPVKCPLLKLEVVHVQFLCEHATWRHSNLERKQKKSCICTSWLFFCAVVIQPTTLGSSTFFSAGISAVVRMYVPEKQSYAQKSFYL